MGPLQEWLGDLEGPHNYISLPCAWQHAYMAAVCESDNSLKMIRIYEALAAIEQRRLTPVEPDSEEDRELEAAETGLRSLITERTEGGAGGDDSRISLTRP